MRGYFIFAIKPPMAAIVSQAFHLYGRQPGQQVDSPGEQEIVLHYDIGGEQYESAARRPVQPQKDRERPASAPEKKPGSEKRGKHQKAVHRQRVIEDAYERPASKERQHRPRPAAAGTVKSREQAEQARISEKEPEIVKAHRRAANFCKSPPSLSAAASNSAPVIGAVRSANSSAPSSVRTFASANTVSAFLSAAFPENLAK